MELWGSAPAWIAGGAVSLLVAHTLIARADAGLSMTYWLFTLVLYYAGNSFILASRRIPRLLIGRFGEARALGIYDTLLGLMFLNQGLGVSCMGALVWWEQPTSFGPLATTLGVACFAIGLVTKVWATMLVGVDVYYYHDMFLGRATGAFVSAGPYRFLANPMYGVGQLHAYGYGLLTSSPVGLVAAAVCHSLIYVFYFSVERPFVRRAFLSAPFGSEAEDGFMVAAPPEALEGPPG
ncbi:MAG: phosphatidylethanolamine N-methyltransferase family protein [Deltaproteobacteria bacterium]|nr:phosphatidylethanolamine N-methyltransferase family protein [Deltaproteobacteria bacterium]